MKNFTLVLNGVTLVAVAVLFYLHFAGKSGNQGLPANNAGKTTSNGNFKIAYFEMDSIQNNYEYFKQVVKELGVSEQSKRNELASRKSALYNKAKEYQDKAASMTPAELEKARQEISEKEREYQAFEAGKGQEMQDENFKKLQDVKKKIEEYLKGFSQQNGYSFVFANNSASSEMYYKDTIYNITNELIKGLNEQYKKKN